MRAPFPHQPLNCHHVTAIRAIMHLSSGNLMQFGQSRHSLSQQCSNIRATDQTGTTLQQATPRRRIPCLSLRTVGSHHYQPPLTVHLHSGRQLKTTPTVLALAAFNVITAEAWEEIKSEAAQLTLALLKVPPIILPKGGNPPRRSAYTKPPAVRRKKQEDLVSGAPWRLEGQRWLTDVSLRRHERKC